MTSALSVPPSPHPWHQRNPPWLDTGLVEAALIQSETCQDLVKSIKLLADIGNIGVAGVYADQRFTSGLSSFIEKLVEGWHQLNPSLHSEALTALTELWIQSKVGNLNFPPSVLARLLERCEDLFTRELEQAILDSSWLSEGQEQHFPLVLRPISQSQSLFVKFTQIFASKLKQNENQNQPMMMKTFRHFSEVIVSSRANPITLYPAKQQGLVALLLLYSDIGKIGTEPSSRLEDLREKIVHYDLSDESTWLICAQFNVLNLF